MRRRTIALGMAVGLILSMSLAVAPVSAGPPTEIDVSPFFQDLIPCGTTARAYWTVDLYGGTSGTFNVVVYWGRREPRKHHLPHWVIRHASRLPLRQQLLLSVVISVAKWRGNEIRYLAGKRRLSPRWGSA